VAFDYLGNDVTAELDSTRAAIDDFVGGFLCYETRAAKIIAAAAADPGNCLANAYAGMIFMLLEAPEAAARASGFIAHARAAAAGATLREQRNVEFLTRWAASDIAGALSVGEEIADAFPRDLVIVKLHQYLNFNRGRATEMLRIAEKVLPKNTDVPHMHGMIAFAFEQCHLLEEAEDAARTALEMKAKEPWAQHALAHVMLTQGRIDEGAAFLESVRGCWTDLNSFMVTHLWWHLALFYLSQGRARDALDAYDSQCWGVDKTYSQDQVGAVSLLARLELAGVDVGDRWNDLSAHLALRARDTVEPFLTLQYLYGLARAGKAEADILQAAICERAETAPDRESWRDVALPASDGLVAYARGDFAAAIRDLGAASPRLSEIGGSHAQRDLFTQIVLDANVRSGRWDAAQQELELRRVFDSDSVPLNRTLALVYAALDLPNESARAAARVVRTLKRHRIS
jgi:tetratricopeptide (TPR) repeat protein